MLIDFADMQLDALRFLLWRDGKPVALRPKVFDLLIHLVRNRERVVSREELRELLWGDTIVGSGSLSGLINELRTALGEPGGPNSSIRTVHARGYQFVAEVRAAKGGNGHTEDKPNTPDYTLDYTLDKTPENTRNDNWGESNPGAEPVGGSRPLDPSVPVELLDDLRLRLIQFLREEISPIVESEGFGPLYVRIIDSLFLDLGSQRGRSASDVAASTDPSRNSFPTIPERRMRLTRPKSSNERKHTG